MRTGFWDRQWANIASRQKEMYGITVVSSSKAVISGKK